MAESQMITVQRNTSRARQVARKLGIEIEPPTPHLPMTEQEQTDTM
jgi:hypothetical protein